MPNITIDINDPSTIDEAIKYMQNLQKGIETATKEVVQTLAEDASAMAEAQFASASYAGNNDTQVNVRYENSGKKAKVTASGSSVLFIEFGAGIYKTDNYEERDDVVSGGSGLTLHGFYGKGRGANPKGWVYTGEVGSIPPLGSRGTKDIGNGKVHTYGNDANSSMWKAKKYAKRMLNRVAKESFKKYL